MVDNGEPGQEILHAYVVKEALRTVLALSCADPEPHVLRRTLARFYASAAGVGAPEIHRLAKHEGRNAFGFRNPINVAAYAGLALAKHRQVSVTTTELPGQMRSAGIPLREQRGNRDSYDAAGSPTSSVR